MVVTIQLRHILLYCEVWSLVKLCLCTILVWNIFGICEDWTSNGGLHSDSSVETGPDRTGQDRIVVMITLSLTALHCLARQLWPTRTLRTFYWDLTHGDSVGTQYTTYTTIPATQAEFSTSMSRLYPWNCWRQLSYAIIKPSRASKTLY